MKFVPLALWIGCIVMANWFTLLFGFMPVGFGLQAPAGTYFVGIAFTLRDIAQETVGRRMVLLGIAVGALLSMSLDPRLGIASGITFLVSETADFAIYTPLRNRNWIGAVVASNVVGLVIDSALFLWLAFGSLDFIGGQIVGKVEMTVLAAMLLLALRAFRSRSQVAWR